MFETCLKHVSNGFKTRLNVFQTKTPKKRFTISPLVIWRVTYLLFLSATALSLISSYRSVWRTEQNVRTVNAQGALSLIRCKPGELKEMCGPYERCSRFVTAFSVRTNRKSKMRTESVRVYWTCMHFYSIGK